MDEREEIVGELESIREASDGILKPEAVVEFAKDPETKLHDCFEWDDGDAAHQYRLWQARNLIKTMVTILKDQTEPVETYVSLLSDRKEPGGGYRLLVDVLADAEKRNELLQQALAELERFKKKYAQLKELSEAFKGIDRVLAKNGKKRPAVRRKAKLEPRMAASA